MRVLFTGASSFTGLWFVGRLAAIGAKVTAALRGSPETYEGARAERARWLTQWAEILPNHAFGGEAFLDLVGRREFDVICHHGAEVGDYRSPDFDVPAALAANTRNAREALGRLAARGARALVMTGSVFEPDEGVGPEPRRAFSPYGVSKALTFEAMRFYGEAAGLSVSKFVIANPFGPFEDPRFVAHAVAAWARGEPFVVQTPRYLRDNIHVDLLGLAYARFVAEAAAGSRTLGPCGYLETQGAFAERLARELAPRLGLKGEVRLAQQTDFAEPLARVNRDAIDPAAYGWDEGAAWDALAAFYRRFGAGASLRAAPEIVGALDALDNSGASGWLALKGGGEPRHLRVMADGVERCTARADGWRLDLHKQNISDGRSGFRVLFPGGLDPYRDVNLRFEDRETGAGIATRVAPRLVGGPQSRFAPRPDAGAAQVVAATYSPGEIRLTMDALSAAGKLGAPRFLNATALRQDGSPSTHPYLDAAGLTLTRWSLTLRAHDLDAPVVVRFTQGADPLGDVSVPAQPPAGGGVGEQAMRRVSGPTETPDNFAAGGHAMAARLDGLVRRHFGRGLAEFGPVLDWGAGAGRVAGPLKRAIAPGVELLAVDIDAIGVEAGRRALPEVRFAEVGFLPPTPFADAAFGAIYAISVFTHLTEGAQFAWLRELRRLARPGAPVIASVHSEFHLFRVAADAPELLADAVARGLSDRRLDDNLGPELGEPGYYRSTFHTRAYVETRWGEYFDIVAIHAGGNGPLQDLVVMRAR